MSALLDEAVNDNSLASVIRAFAGERRAKQKSAYEQLKDAATSFFDFSLLKFKVTKAEATGQLDKIHERQQAEMRAEAEA